MNAIRALVEAKENPIVSIHDHGAGGHLNCLSELVEDTGGSFDINKFPVGDPTLSDKEIISNESQERMGLAIHEDEVEHLKKVSERERAPMYIVGTATGDKQLTFTDPKDGLKPVDLKLEHFFGSSPKTILRDTTSNFSYDEIKYLSLIHI